MSLSRYCITQVRTAVNFFARYREDQLWKTITSVSPAGKKKGRLRTRQPVRPIQNFYRIGSSPMKVQYPGLNASIRSAIDPILVDEQTDEEKEKGLNFIRQRLEERGKFSRRRINEKLHPLERGFSGPYVVGQRLGPPPPDEGVNFDDFQSYCLRLQRTCKMTRIFGRVYTVKALVVVGNGKGVAGFSVAPAPLFRTNLAIARAMKRASKRLFHIDLLEDRTIYQDFYAESRSCRVFAQRMPKGYGLNCHPRLKKICEVVGIKDMYAKVEGATHNYRGLIQAFVTGLVNQESHQRLAERSRLHVVEMSANRQYFPRIVASPVSVPVKADDEVTVLERLKLDDFYGEGRLPLHKRKKTPIHINSPQHIRAEYHRHPYRNQEKKIIRLLADNVVRRWTRPNRHAYSRNLNSLALTGMKDIPIGLGLSDVVDQPEVSN